MEKINDIRKQKNMSIDDLPDKSGVPKSTLSKITAGITKNPNIDTVFEIARAFEVAVDIFVDDDGKKRSKGNLLEWHTPLTEAYIGVAKNTHQVACTVLSIDYVDPGVEAEEATALRRFEKKAAVDTFSYVEDDTSEDIEYPVSIVPKGTSFAIQLEGDSMMPAIPTHVDFFVISQRILTNNEIGVFMYDHMAMCRRLVKDGKNILLISDNSKYGPIRISSDEECFGVIGKVLGWT
ncbi:MAG: LexA family transcriptional regulator [Clostridiales bacterium]|nr:LexA family transcriptional regulator [Clostridiales bacterium]